MKSTAKPDRILPGIASFDWNADRSRVAVCPQSREILIFKTNGKPNIKDWDLEAVLKEVSSRKSQKISLQNTFNPNLSCPAFVAL